MKRWLVIIGIVACSIFAFWAYSMSGKTRAAVSELRGIERQILKERETIEMLRAEWAFLNRPERLRHLIEMNFENLGLMQISARNYGEASMVPYPTMLSPNEELPIIDPTEIETILADLMDEGVDFP